MNIIGEGIREKRGSIRENTWEIREKEEKIREKYKLSAKPKKRSM